MHVNVCICTHIDKNRCKGIPGDREGEGNKSKRKNKDKKRKTAKQFLARMRKTEEGERKGGIRKTSERYSSKLYNGSPNKKREKEENRRRKRN